MTDLFLPATRICRSGQKFDSAMAVDPPTRPVPPRTRILELRIFSGSGTSVALLVAVAVAFKFNGVHFKFRDNESGAIEFRFLFFLCVHFAEVHSLSQHTLSLGSLKRDQYLAKSTPPVIFYNI